MKMEDIIITYKTMVASTGDLFMGELTGGGFSTIHPSRISVIVESYSEVWDVCPHYLRLEHLLSSCTTHTSLDKHFF